MKPAKNHSSTAHVFGRAARVMAALRRKKAIWISCFHLRWRALAEICWPVAARCNVCCVLQGSGDCWVWSTVCCPNQGATEDVLNSKVWNFSSATCDVTIKGCLCCIRAVAALEDVQDKIIFTSMYNHVENWRKNSLNECCDNATQVAQYARNFKPRLWSFIGLIDLKIRDMEA